MKNNKTDDDLRLESFAELASVTADDLDRFGGSTMLCGTRFTYRDTARLHNVASEIRSYLKGEFSPEAEDRMRAILAWIDRHDNPGTYTGAGRADKAKQKTYVVNGGMRYRIGLYLRDLDEQRVRFQNGELAAVTALGKTYGDAADFGDFVNTVRSLHDRTLKHGVTGKEYAMARQCECAGRAIEKEDNT